MPEPEAYVEAVGSRAVAARLDRIEEELSSVRGELGANEREHSELGYCAAHGHWWVRGSFHALYDWTCSTCGATRGRRT